VTGSYYVQRRSLPWEAFVLAIPVGVMIAAILVVNNIRDIDSDRRANKRTLAVRLGRERTRSMFVAMLAVAFASGLICWLAGPLSPWLLLTVLAVPLAVRVARTVWTHSDGPTLNAALAQTGILALLYCLALSAGVLAS
jgi:1,4-dihydroxy-2-naphthoate octaprenyltransferase